MVRLHHYGKNWGGRSLGHWLEIVAGRWRIDFYWEPENDWRFYTSRGALTCGPLTVIAQNWRKQKARLWSHSPLQPESNEEQGK